MRKRRQAPSSHHASTDVFAYKDLATVDKVFVHDNYNTSPDAGYPHLTDRNIKSSPITGDAVGEQLPIKRSPVDGSPT